MPSTPSEPPKFDIVPEGFPHELDDDALTAAAATYAEGLRRTTGKSGVGYRNEGVVLGYGTLLDVAHAELFRRSLRRSENIARIALAVAILASLTSVALGVANIITAC